MSVKLLIDMNLPPAWVPVLRRHGWEAVHWSEVGVPAAADPTLMAWALEHGFAVFTHDLDFGHLLALTHARGPSVLQVRAQDVLPNALETAVVAALRQHEQDLHDGALVVVEPGRMRVRVLPI